MPSLLEAIVKKYECFDQIPIAVHVPRKHPRYMIPNLLVLNDWDVDSAGQESDLRDKCRGVEELDLAQNRLSRWNEVSFQSSVHLHRWRPPWHVDRQATAGDHNCTYYHYAVMSSRFIPKMSESIFKEPSIIISRILLRSY